jgi:hypothetical protein
LANGEKTAGLRYQWEIVREDWWGENKPHWKKPPAETGLFTDSTTQQVNFTAPAHPGPYRVFVTVFNEKGYCATANTPFYVVQ